MTAPTTRIPAMARRLAACVLVACVSPLPAALAAQDAGGPAADPTPPWFAIAMAEVTSGDTTAAIDRLRQAVREHRGYGPAWLLLGQLLSVRASELESEFSERIEARQALEAANRLMPDDPIALLEYGLLLRKQQARVDAMRVLDRAWEAAKRRGDDLPPESRARLHFELGRIYETWWEDWQDMVMAPPVALSMLSCPDVLFTPSDPAQALAIHAVVCPRPWAAAIEATVPLAELKEQDRWRMLTHFRRAFEADPGHVDTATRLLGHLADAGEWAAYDSIARRVVLAAPEDPRSHLFLGLGLHERGRSAEAEAAFRQALALLPEEDRRRFDDVTLLLPPAQQSRFAELDSASRAETARLFFTGKDPLFLTDVNERRLEHYARLAWTELKFGAPASGLRGWDSERGEIYIRYGAPLTQLQCCYGAGGLRFHYWSYGTDGPNFVFTRPLTYRRATLTGPAKALADELAVRTPEAYRPRTLTSIHDLPHQVVRFRAAEPGLTRVEVYGELPLDSLGLEPGDSVETGVFLFDAAYNPLWAARRSTLVDERAFGLTYRLDVPPGEFLYGVEARRAAPDSVPRPAARARAALAAPGFPEHELSVSDLLVATLIRPRTEMPMGREDLAIAPSRTLRFASGDPVHLYFEVYGLQADEQGLVRYDAELTVEGQTRRSVVQRVLRGAAELFRRSDPGARVVWQRTAPSAGDRTVDYLRVELPPVEPGEYAIRIQITDSATGQSAAATRRIHIGPPPEEIPEQE